MAGWSPRFRVDPRRCGQAGCFGNGQQRRVLTVKAAPRAHERVVGSVSGRIRGTKRPAPAGCRGAALNKASDS